MSRYIDDNYGRHLSRPAGRKRPRRRRRRGSAIAVSMLALCTVIMVSAIGSALELCMPDAFAAGSQELTDLVPAQELAAAEFPQLPLRRKTESRPPSSPPPTPP